MAIDADTTPRAFIEQHHYAGTYPAARERFGLYRRGELVGCAVFSHPTNDKVLSNVAEVRARGAPVIAIATEGSERVGEVADQTLYVPATDWVLQPILAIVPLQLLAYHVARIRGLNVDQPRNLAKTVTVE